MNLQGMVIALFIMVFLICIWEYIKMHIQWASTWTNAVVGDQVEFEDNMTNMCRGVISTIYPDSRQFTARISHVLRNNKWQEVAHDRYITQSHKRFRLLKLDEFETNSNE